VSPWHAMYMPARLLRLPGPTPMAKEALCNMAIPFVIADAKASPVSCLKASSNFRMTPELVPMNPESRLPGRSKTLGDAYF